MKKFTWIAGIILTLIASATAEACTATSVYNRATLNEDTDWYDTAKDVLETDGYIDDQNWTHYESIHAAIGTLMREAWEHGRYYYGDNTVEAYDRYLTDTADARALMDRPARVQHSGYPTVRDHTVLHGGQWEETMTTDPPTDPPPPPPPIDHAG